MSLKERRRLEVLARVRDREIRLRKAAELLGVSDRQAIRIYARYRTEGDEGLVHRSRGQPSGRSYDAKHREKCLKLYRKRYSDFGPTLAAEYLAEEGLKVDHETLRRWLLSEGLWTKVRGRSKHRSWRARKDCAGEMVQMDGSIHDWFEGRRGWAVLMVIVDDATGETYARFYEGETTAAAFDVFGRYVKKKGIPWSLYVDRDSIYRSDRQATIEEELKAESPLTQFGRAMKKLGVELILAHSPQAKGRVERRNGTLQDRLVKALRLAGIDDVGAANEYLEAEFLPEFNRKFVVKPANTTDVHVPMKRGIVLDEVLCFEEKRVVQPDWCVGWRCRFFQVDRAHERLALVGRKVTVREKLDGSLQLLYKERKLVWRELPERPVREKRQAPVRESRRWVPPANHPWRGKSTKSETQASGAR